MAALSTLSIPERAEAVPAETPARPRWAHPALAILLLGTALLYLWDLGASGMANNYYAAAVQAGTQSWKALFFGSFDPANFITVDKPPASLWLMGLPARIFGFSSWSMLVPEALCGVATVALVYGMTRRWFGYPAGLLAGAVTALTPAAVLMFRFNNPDALLVLLLTLSAYGVVRALEKGRTGWLLLAGGAVGFAFLNKMLQAFLVLPALGLVYLIAAPVPLGKRLWQLGAALGALIVSAGWWVAIVELWPASSRPYIGGSAGNSVLELAFGYNGLSRITGGEGPGGSSGGPGGGGFGGGNGSFGGPAGLFRLFQSEMGVEVSWLLPAALIAIVAGAWLTRRAARTDRLRAAIVLWGGWLLGTGLVFSYMEGIVHPYYTVALAPPIGALVAIVGTALWRVRRSLGARLVLAAMVGATALWSYVLLNRTPEWQPWLRYALVVEAVVAIGALFARGVLRVAVVAAVVAGLAGSTAYAAATASVPHSGSIPSAGPSSVDIGASGGFRAGPDPSAVPSRPGAPSGGGESATVSSELVRLLQGTNTRWAAATNGAQSAASLQLASGKAIMAIGGFSGDPAPTLAQFRQWVAEGKVRYYIGGSLVLGMGGGMRGGSGIASWVQANFIATTVGTQTVYDLLAR